MDETYEAWQRRLARRRDDLTPWSTIAADEGIPRGTFNDGRKRAERKGWLPPEAQLPPAVRSDGRHVGTPQEKRILEATIPEASHDDSAMSTSVDIVPVNTDFVPLSPDEMQTLAHYEQIIERGIKTFVEVGHALLVIRDQRLYRQDYGSFEDYLRERWDLSRPRAYQLIDAAQVVDAVSTIVDIVPVNEAQARPLTTLPPEQQREVWREAVETAPASGVTAKHVQATVRRVKERTSGKKVDTPKPKEPEPRRPARQEVQEGLIWGLREVDDEDAWEMLEWLWDGLNDLAPKYHSLRGMLDRVQRRFPEEHRSLMDLPQAKHQTREDGTTLFSEA